MGGPPADEGRHKLNTIQLCVVIFFCVCGGPFGMEEAVRHGGAGWTLAAILAMPVIWSLPVALLTSELGSAIPQNGGYIVWVDRAFGPFWGFFEGYTAWFSDVFDNALYPILFTTYLEALIAGGSLRSGHVFTPVMKYIVRYTSLAFVAVCNVGGMQAVGYVSIFFAMCTMAPFFLFVCFGAEHFDLAVLETFEPVHEVHWGIVLSTCMWAIDGWDAPANVCGQVKNPQKTYPKAVCMVMVVAVCSLFFPVAVGLSIEPDIHEWHSDNGLWAKVAYVAGGEYLQWAVVSAGMISNLAMFNVLLATSVWSLYALALPGLLDVPALTHLHSSFRTPVLSVVINTLAVAVVLMFDFTFLVQIDVTLNCFNLLLGDFALLWLRIKEPDLPRPYKIPFGTVGTCIFYLPHILLCSYMMFAIDKEAQLVVALITMAGLAIFSIGRYFSSRRRAAHVPPLRDVDDVDLASVFENVPATLAEEHDQLGVTEDELPIFGITTTVTVETGPLSTFSRDLGARHFMSLDLTEHANRPWEPLISGARNYNAYGADDVDDNRSSRFWRQRRTRSDDFWSAAEKAKRARRGNRDMKGFKRRGSGDPPAVDGKPQAPAFHVPPPGMPQWAKPPSSNPDTAGTSGDSPPSSPRGSREEARLPNPQRPPPPAPAPAEKAATPPPPAPTPNWVKPPPS